MKRGPLPVQRYSWANLEATKAAVIADSNRATPSRNDWARALDCSHRAVADWMRQGIPEYQADRIAVKCLGTHPSLIWPEWFNII